MQLQGIAPMQLLDQQIKPCYCICCRFLHLDGMSLSEIRTVEDHYLAAAKWPWNKVQDGFVRTHPEWNKRLLISEACMMTHLSDYHPQSRHMQGLAQLGLQQDAGSMATQMLESEQVANKDAEAGSDMENGSSEGDMLMDDDQVFEDELDDGELSEEDVNDFDLGEEAFVDFGDDVGSSWSCISVRPQE